MDNILGCRVIGNINVNHFSYTICEIKPNYYILIKRKSKTKEKVQREKDLTVLEKPFIKSLINYINDSEHDYDFSILTHGQFIYLSDINHTYIMDKNPLIQQTVIFAIIIPESKIPKSLYIMYEKYPGAMNFMRCLNYTGILSYIENSKDSWEIYLPIDSASIDLDKSYDFNSLSCILFAHIRNKSDTSLLSGKKLSDIKRDVNILKEFDVKINGTNITFIIINKMLPCVKGKVSIDGNILYSEHLFLKEIEKLKDMFDRYTDKQKMLEYEYDRESKEVLGLL